MKHELIIGFITFGKLTEKYLPSFLSSLNKQTFKDFKILVFDNTDDGNAGNAEYIKNNFSSIEILSEGRNIGFAKAYNKMIKRAVEMGVKYFLTINPDMILEPDAIEKMIKTLDDDERLGSVSPKILKWDFLNNKKTNIIDTCGIKLKSGLRFIDIGQGENDKNQFNNIDILGPSGACGMYRIDVLKNNVFDELMFMYKEDCDLAYRLNLAGYKSKCVSDAVVYHDRTAQAKGESNFKIALNRKNKSKQVKKWSFLNQQIIFLKYWKSQNFKNKIAIIIYELKIIIFIILFEQYLLKEFIKLWRMRKKIKI